jgi:elongator complex protein 1
MYRETRREPKVQNRAITANLVNGTHSDPQPESSSKVNRICDAVLEVLQTRTATNLQNIITANVCKSPPALEDGLLVVAGLMNESEALAEKAVEHICFLADANKLYDTALGLYNLDLALLVAQQSQKDPREYLPFLQKLQEMAVLRRHFSIDDHLGRHSKALSHLHELSKTDHSEVESYLVKHALYKDAITLYRYQPTRLDSIMSLYASYLELHSQFHEAAIAYEYLHIYGPASTCYQHASPTYWRESIFCASQQSPPLSQEAFTSLATALAESLTEAKDYESAAYIHSTYLSSVPSAVALLCKGHHFASALQLASLHSTSHPELISADGPIDTGLTDAHSASTELLAECKAQLLAQVPRIRELRLKAAADPLAFYEGEVNEDLPDDISVAASSRLSTSASLFTRYTGRQSLGTAATGVSRVTSKNRRREERKRARGKKGSVYEEEYLVASVQRLVERIESVRGDVGRLVAGLVRRRMREQARAVEGLFGEVLEMCKEAVKEIFEEEGKGEEQIGMGTGEEGYRPVGGDAVLAESIEAAGKRKVAPHIGAFEKLTLLGA